MSPFQYIWRLRLVSAFENVQRDVLRPYTLVFMSYNGVIAV